MILQYTVLGQGDITVLFRTTIYLEIFTKLIFLDIGFTMRAQRRAMTRTLSALVHTAQFSPRSTIPAFFSGKACCKHLRLTRFWRKRSCGITERRMSLASPSTAVLTLCSSVCMFGARKVVLTWVRDHGHFNYVISTLFRKGRLLLPFRRCKEWAA